MNRIGSVGLAAVAVLAAAACGGSVHTAANPPSSSAAVSASRTVAPAATPTSAAASGQWLGYHATPARTGAVPAVPALDPAARAWNASLGAAVYGQVVSGDGLLFAATEQDRVTALSPATGAVVWSRSIGTPLTDVSGVAGCGDIAPLGITSTPALDPTTDTLYVVGEVVVDGQVQHRLAALDATTGAVRLTDDVDPPLPAGESPAQLLQRAGLALADGRVYVAYGGNDGDCGAYHGWVVGVAQSGAPDEVSFEVASDGQGGAVWEAGGAPAIDAAGDVYVTTGNANPDPPQGGPDPKAYTESVVKLSPALRPLAAYKDRIAGGDEDLATGNPVLLPGGAVFAVG
jgi:polyvinyl alcohol dehydrogenase (cytochrome)